MTDQEEQALKETRRKERLAAEDIEQLARDQTRKKAYIAKEQAIEEDQKARKTNAKKQTRE